MSLPAGAVVTVIGDSHVDGLAQHLQREFSQQGWQTGQIVARSGWSTYKFTKDEDISQLVKQVPATAVLIVLGTNDARASSRYSEYVRQVAVQAAAGGAKVYWAGPPAVTRPDIAQSVSKIADIQNSTLAGTGATWIDLRPETPQDQLRDGVHLTSAGYSQLAHSIVNKMQGNNLFTIVLIAAAGILAAALLWPKASAEPVPATP